MRQHARRSFGARVSVPCIILTLLVALAAPAAAAPSDDGAAAASALEKLTPRLAALIDPTTAPTPPDVRVTPLTVATEGAGTMMRRGDRVVTLVRVVDTSDGTLAAIAAAGGEITHMAARYARLTVAIREQDLLALARVPAVLSVAEQLNPLIGTGASESLVRGTVGVLPELEPDDALVAAAACVGSVTSEADTQMKAVNARTAFRVTGAGVTVGVLSDSYDVNTSDATSAAQDIASGDLPGVGNSCGRTTPVNVIAESGVGGIDEGRGMLQLVHDLAPDANLAFATANGGQFAFADNIRALEAAGARVIVDDVSYFEEPMFQPGPIDIAITEVTAAGSIYYSSAGNSNIVVSGNNVGSWETPAYRPTTCPAAVAALVADCMDFNPGAGADNTFRYTIGGFGTTRQIFGWNEPWDGITTDLDVFALTTAGALIVGSTNANLVTQTPFEFLSLQNNGSGPASFDLVVGRKAGSTGTPRFKTAFFRANLTVAEYMLSSGGDIVGPTINGHNGGPNTVSVAAVPFDNASIPESFTSHGPVTHYWGPADGTTPAAPLASPRVLAKPDLAGTDGGQTTFFIGTSPPYRFYGTSAAAPHAAAVAALMLDGFPGATVNQIKNTQKSQAAPVGTAGPTVVGTGLIDARKSVALLLPGVRINNLTRVEGDSGTKVFPFTLTLSKPSAATVKIKVTTQPGTALAGSDYVTKTQTITFLPGQTTRTFGVTVKGNTTVEPNETFTVRLSLPSHCKIIDGTGVGTIVNDD